LNNVYFKFLIFLCSLVPKEKYLSKFPVESIAYFPLSQTVSEKNVKRATLLLYIATPEGYEGKKIKLTVSDAKYRNESFVNRAVLLRSRGHWERVDVSQMVRSWAADEDNNYGLYIRAMIGQKNVAYLNEDPIEARNISTKSQKVSFNFFLFNYLFLNIIVLLFYILVRISIF